MFNSILVAGGAGFVGSHVVDSLVEKGYDKIVVVDNLFLGKEENLVWAKAHGRVVLYKEDARYITALENIIRREECDAVVNLAVKCLPYGFIDPEGAYMTGVEIALNLANLLRKGCYKRLLHFSSSEVYGSAQKIPMDETHPLQAHSPYGAGKAAADLLLLSYSKLFGCEASIIRPFNMYGPRQNMDAYAAVIPITISRILNNQPPILEGDGEQTRDLAYVKDIAEMSLIMLESDNCIGRVVNVGSGQEFRIKDIIFKICDLLGYPCRDTIHAPERPADVRRLCTSIRLAKKLLGYSQKTNFDDGLRMTIDWYKTSARERS